MFKITAKRKYEKKLSRELESHKDFLIEKMKKEWDQIQKTAKRERLVAEAKAGAATLAKAFLALLAVGGVLTVGAIAPNIFAAYGKMTGRRGFFEKKNFNRAKNYLSERKFIEINSKNKGEFTARITSKGLNKVLREEFKKLQIEKPKKWDGFWRIVIFDIPDRHKWTREGFRNKLKEAGFYQLQESVFIMPYPCEEEVKFLISVFNITDYVRFIKTPIIWSDDDLRQYFGLVS